MEICGKCKTGYELFGTLHSGTRTCEIQRFVAECRFYTFLLLIYETVQGQQVLGPKKLGTLLYIFFYPDEKTFLRVVDRNLSWRGCCAVCVLDWVQQSRASVCQKTRVLVGPRISPAPSYHADPCLLVFYPKREETKLNGVRYALNVIKSEIMFMFVWID